MISPDEYTDDVSLIFPSSCSQIVAAVRTQRTSLLFHIIIRFGDIIVIIFVTFISPLQQEQVCRPTLAVSYTFENA